MASSEVPFTSEQLQAARKLRMISEVRMMSLDCKLLVALNQNYTRSCCKMGSQHTSVPCESSEFSRGTSRSPMENSAGRQLLFRLDGLFGGLQAVQLGLPYSKTTGNPKTSPKTGRQITLVQAISSKKPNQTFYTLRRILRYFSQSWDGVRSLPSEAV